MSQVARYVDDSCHSDRMRIGCENLGGSRTSPCAIHMPAARHVCALTCLLLIAISTTELHARSTAEDPLQSFVWHEMHARLLDNAPVTFDERVKVLLPDEAEDSMNVPVLVDASQLDDVVRIVVFAELNPIPKVLEFEPLQAQARIGFRLKVQQTTPVRAAVLTGDGVWHVGGRIVGAAGGGCTAPSLGSANPDWSSRLGEVSARLWQKPRATRLRLRVMHPMDTGLVDGIPAFYLERLALRDAQGDVLSRLKLFEPVAENPMLTFDLPKLDRVTVEARDNNGNPVSARISTAQGGR